MTEPTYEGQQMAAHMVLGFIPTVRVRYAVPDEHGGWCWSRWRLARIAEVIWLNSKLIQTWRK